MSDKPKIIVAGLDADIGTIGKLIREGVGDPGVVLMHPSLECPTHATTVVSGPSGLAAAPPTMIIRATPRAEQRRVDKSGKQRRRERRSAERKEKKRKRKF